MLLLRLLQALFRSLHQLPLLSPTSLSVRREGEGEDAVCLDKRIKGELRQTLARGKEEQEQEQEQDQEQGGGEGGRQWQW